MSTSQDNERLLQEVDSVVQEAFAWFEGPGLTSQARVDQWGAWEILAHFLYWHQLTIDSLESVTKGGPPLGISAPLDETNAMTLARQAGKSIPDLTAEWRGLHDTYLDRVRSFSELDAPVRVRGDGTQMNMVQALEMSARHIRGHMQQLQEAVDTTS